MDEMKKVAAALKAVREAVRNGDWYATMLAMADLTKAMAEAGKAVVGPFLPSAAGANDVQTEMALLEAELHTPRTAAGTSAFDWSKLIASLIALLEIWKAKQ